MLIAFYFDPNNVKFHRFPPCLVHAFDLNWPRGTHPNSQDKY